MNRSADNWRVDLPLLVSIMLQELKVALANPVSCIISCTLNKQLHNWRDDLPLLVNTISQKELKVALANMYNKLYTQ